MAVKITRQPKKIALLGAATSAAALRAGHERAPEALRAAGLVERLKTAGFEVSDHGNTATYLFQPDDERPRARNVAEVLKSLNDLRPRVEIAVKSGALPVILSGDCMPVLAIIAGARRYYRNISLIYMDRDADLNVPATTSTGSVDSMVISQVIGVGAPELVRFWGEPPLVRGPDIALFGLERLDPSEEHFLVTSPIRRHRASDISAKGSAAAAHAALERVHVTKNEFVLHFDVDVIAGEEFPWTNFPGADGLTLTEVRDALRVFVNQPNIAAFEVAGYNPELDPDGKGARVLIDLLTDVLAARLEPSQGDSPTESPSTSSIATPSPVAASLAVTESGSEPVVDSASSADPDPITS